MPRFRDDNTEGYDAAQLAELNRRFTAKIEKIAISSPEDVKDKSLRDYIAEQVQADFDDGR